jgi:hypothetical protein
VSPPENGASYLMLKGKIQLESVFRLRGLQLAAMIKKGEQAPAHSPQVLGPSSGVFRQQTR